MCSFLSGRHSSASFTDSKVWYVECTVLSVGVASPHPIDIDLVLKVRIQTSGSVHFVDFCGMKPFEQKHENGYY